MHMTTFPSAIEFFYDPKLAAQYVESRNGEAALLLSKMQWSKGTITGTLRCEIYGHSILWDISGKALHAGHTDYEVLPKGADDYELGNLQQVVAFILARNW